MHELYWDPTLNIEPISASKEKSDQFSTYCQQLLYAVKDLNHLIPKDPIRWSKLAFDVHGAVTASQNPSVKSCGIFGQITGSRAHIVIADDIEVPKTAETQHQRERLEQRTTEFSSIAIPEKSRIIYLGTPQDEDSLYNRLPGRGFYRRFYPARYPDPKVINTKYGDDLAPFIAKDCEEKAGEPTEPTRFDEAELLYRQADMGRSNFQLQFQLDTTLSDADKYPMKLSDLIVFDINPEQAPEKLVWTHDPEYAWKEPLSDLNVGFRGDRYYRPMKVAETWRPYTGAVMYVDPSGTGKDETGYAVVKMLNGFLFVTALGGFLEGYTDATLSGIARIAVGQGVSRILVEKNLGGGMFSELLKPHLRKARTKPDRLAKGELSYGVTVEDILSTGQKEKRIIDTLEPVLNQHRLVVSPKLIQDDFHRVPETDGSAYRAFYQLSRCTKDRGCLKHDDRLEAMAGAVSYWVAQMAQDADEQIRYLHDTDFEKDLESFRENALSVGGSPNQLRRKEPNWMGSILG